MTTEPLLAHSMPSLWERLKAETRSAHQQLDQRITACEPFASIERYRLFVLMQHDFHQAVSPLYQDPALGCLIEGLGERDRLRQIEADLVDLDVAMSHKAVTPTTDDVHVALGWVYVAEGSNLGAAFLLKAAQRLGLSETFGARHLAAAPNGRAAHWKSFTAALDTLELSLTEEDKVVAGANAAFAFAHNLVVQRFAARPA